MDAAGGDAHQHVTDFHLRTVDQFALFDDAGSETGDVVFPVTVHARHLGGFAADQGAARLAAAFRHAGDNGFHLLGNIMAQRHIVEEEQRLGALRQHVVDAHRHRVDADGVVLVHGEGDLELRTHAVGAAHQDRLLVTEGRQVEHTAERPDAAHPTGALGRCHMLFDAPDHFVARFQAHACLFIINCHIVF